MKRWIGIFLALAFVLRGCGLTEEVVQPDSVTVPAAQPPRPEPQPATQATDLSDVSHWLYLIDVDLEDELVDVIAESSYDMAVIEIAERDGVDPAQEMIGWVEALGDYGRERNEDFIVIGQNAAELGAFDEYVAVVDAIAQEQIWFDGGAHNDPPGDCPLPRTEADIDTDAYRDSLSPECRRQLDEFPEGTLHVSSESYIEHLVLAQSRGLTIFTIDYALEPENIEWVYQTSRGLRFIPFVSNRNLDQFVDPDR